jgi:hypothetical protein
MKLPMSLHRLGNYLGPDMKRGIEADTPGTPNLETIIARLPFHVIEEIVGGK